ncbi:MAG TPA: GAF domain-containing protein [Myxococcales bacterium]|jgi:PAS domain S-box-containing protein
MEQAPSPAEQFLAGVQPSQASRLLLEVLWEAPIAIGLLDRDLRFIQVNRALAELSHLPASDHLGRRPGELFLAPEADRLLSRVLSTGEAVPSTRFRWRRGPGLGDELWLEGSAYPLHGADGAIVGLAAMLRPVDEAQQRAERTDSRLARLQEISGELARALTPEEVAKTVLERVREAAGAQACAVGQQSGPDEARLVATAGLSEVALEPWRRFRLAPGLPATEVFSTLRPVWLESMADAEARFPLAMARAVHLGCEAHAILPMLVEGRCLGALVLSFTEPRRFLEEDKEFLTALAEGCALGFERAQIIEAERQERRRADGDARRFATLQAIGEELSRANTRDEVASLVVGRVLAAVGATTAFVWEALGDRLHVLSHENLPEEVLRFQESASTEAELPSTAAFRSGRPVWIESEQAFAALYPELVLRRLVIGAQSLAALPLVVEGRSIGALTLFFGGPRSFDSSERSFLEIIARQCALALDRARLHASERRERQLAERSAGELEALYTACPVGLAYLDGHLRLLRINRALAELSGVPAEGHVGRTVEEVVPGMALGAWLESGWRQMQRTRRPLAETEMSGVVPGTPDRRRSFLVSVYPVEVAGALEGMGAVVRESTAQREEEEVRRYLLGIVGHDLRTPLSVVLMGVDRLLRGGASPERHQRLLRQVRAAAGRMSRIVDLLLDFTRVRAGKGIPLEPRETELQQVVRQAVGELEATSPGRAIQVVRSPPVRGDWDPDRLGQVLTNLVSNALKFADPGTPVLVRWREEREQDEVCLEVVNRGPVIPAEQLPLIFQPLYQAERRGGVGLGLYIASEIVRAHRGSLTARSGAEEGTVFVVRLPRRAAASRDG